LIHGRFRPIWFKNRFMRADQWLVERGLAASRSQAQRLLAAGARWHAPGGWRALGKSDDLPPDAEVELLDAAEARYASRGGLKLEGALAATGLDVTGARCLDVGQSTGGFTDCLLQHGAASVVGVDVGHGQLHRAACRRPRARLEGVNARHLDDSKLIACCADPVRAEALFDSNFDLIVGDLSFISLRWCCRRWRRCWAPGGTC
jgi:23S rRNA (cytidine1920-2'-O)/16S rRNA (cytidine1409-2'-O)-methyltransferase